MTKKIIHRKYLPLAIATGIFLFGVAFHVKAASPSLTIDFPINNSSLSGSSLTTTFTLSNFRLLDPQTYSKASAGTGHINIWLDQKSFSRDSAIKVFEPKYQFLNMRSGNHQLRAELVNNDNTPLIPPVVAEVKFFTTYSDSTSTRLTPMNILKPLAIAIIFASIALWLMRYQLANTKPNTSKKSAKPLSSKKSKNKTKSKKS